MTYKIISTIYLFTLLLTSSYANALYKCETPSGLIEYSDIPCKTKNPQIPTYSAASDASSLSNRNAGLKSWNQGDYKAAMEIWKPLAEEGNSAAESNLAYMYYTGIGVEKNYKIAFTYYKRAADKGNIIAFNGMGLVYLNGYGVEKDLNQAKYWFEKAANQGNDAAKRNLDLVLKMINERPVSNIKTKETKNTSKPRVYPVYNIIVMIGILLVFWFLVLFSIKIILSRKKASIPSFILSSFLLYILISASLYSLYFSAGMIDYWRRSYNLIPAIIAIIFFFTLIEKRKKTILTHRNESIRDGKPIDNTMELKNKIAEVREGFNNRMASGSDTVERSNFEIKEPEVHQPEEPEPVISQAKNEETKKSDLSIYEMAWNELESGNYDKAIWSKCFMLANGNEKLAKSMYIKHRTEMLEK